MEKENVLFGKVDVKKAEKIVKKTMQLLKEEFPVLIYALNLLTPKAVEGMGKLMSTDGEKLFYDPQLILNVRRNKKILKHQLMHVLLHCLLGHLEMDLLYKSRKLLWAVMDMEVSHILCEIGLETKEFQELERCTSDMCPDISMYYAAKTDRELRREIMEKSWWYHSDEHTYWNASRERKNAGAGTGVGQEGSQGQQAQRWRQAMQLLAARPAQSEGQQILFSLKQSRLGKEWGLEASDEECIVEAAKENQNIYYNRLMQFLQVKEDARELPDAIDPMLYLYGLELYEDVPLIEPPETEERLRLNTICIAMDTSGSCGGEIATHFLRETGNLLRDIRQISTGCEVYFFQCDAQIQKELHYASLQEVNTDEWEQKELYGWGGTSFEPVFERVNELVKKEEKRIDCLIYLTDSYGTCTVEKPEYPVFFILPQALGDAEGNANYNRNLPDWIEMIGLDLELEDAEWL